MRRAVVITGASRGIGRAAAEALKDEFHLILTARREGPLEEFVSKLPSAEAIAFDMGDSAAIESGAAKIRESIASRDDCGGLAGLVLSAGVLVRGPIADVSAPEWERSLFLNVTAPTVFTSLLLPELRRGRGTVVFVNSGSGFSSKPGNGPYSASKFALRAVSDALREEERPNGVRVSSVHPGRVATDMQRELRASEGGEYVEADYVVAETVGHVIRDVIAASPEASFDEVSVRPR